MFTHWNIVLSNNHISHLSLSICSRPRIMHKVNTIHLLILVLSPWKASHLPRLHTLVLGETDFHLPRLAPKVISLTNLEWLTKVPYTDDGPFSFFGRSLSCYLTTTFTSAKQRPHRHGLLTRLIGMVQDLALRPRQIQRKWNPSHCQIYCSSRPFWELRTTVANHWTVSFTNTL